MLITIIDTETTDVEPEKGQLIEIAAILYSITHAAPIQSASSLVPIVGENDAFDVNRISPKLADLCPRGVEFAGCTIGEFVERSDAVVAYGADFDRSWLERHWYAFGKPWVCAMRHINWPCKSSSKALVSVALAHGVGVVSCHRAMTDCDILARLFTRVHEMHFDLERLMLDAMRPRIKVYALTSYEERQLCKDAGFEWDPSCRMWIGEVVEAEIDQLPFNVRRLPQ